MGALGPSELIVIFLVLGSLVFYVLSIVWAYWDAEAREKSGPLVALLVALVAWPLGLLIWLLARPPLGELG